ncbi:hypothetical protein SCA6_013175 [Theobroma cacao]
MTAKVVHCKLVIEEHTIEIAEYQGVTEILKLAGTQQNGQRVASTCGNKLSASKEYREFLTSPMHNKCKSITA